MATTSPSSQDGAYEAQLIEEHRLFARRIDKAAVQIDHVCSAPANQTPAEIKRLIELLEGVLEAAQEHFQHEEAVMTKDGFPGLVVHKRDHDSLIRALKELMSSLGQGPVRLSTEIGMNLRSWLTYHVKRYDEAYAAFAASDKPDAAG